VSGMSPPGSNQSSSAEPIKVALVDDYDVVLAGVAKMLDAYRDRVVVAEIDANKPVEDLVDIALYDSFAQPESDHDEIAELIANPKARRVVVYTWNFHPHLVDSARTKGAHGYLSKALPARELVAALEAVHAGEVVVSDPPGRAVVSVGQDWPGRAEGLTDREAEVLALITQGKSNLEVAQLTFLSPNTVKSYIRTISRKIQVDSRTKAVLWGVQHGFTPDHHRIDHWRGGP
jgi:DNA-binding NarL/FixJ family response regulator